MSKIPEKYTPVELPSRAEAQRMAAEREAWTKTAREQDKPGSAREFELTALLLRFYVKQLPFEPAPEMLQHVDDALKWSKDYKD